jgi:hypothetical protein
MIDHDIELRQLFTPAEALALAQFAMRATLDTFRDRAASEDEAAAMHDAISVVAVALASAGFVPR